MGFAYGTSSDKVFLPWLKPTNDHDYGYTKEKPVEIAWLSRGKRGCLVFSVLQLAAWTQWRADHIRTGQELLRLPSQGSKNYRAGIKVGFLDQFKVTITGQDPVYIYVTLYTAGTISAPKGFTTRGNGG